MDGISGQAIRRIVLQQSHRANVGHIGSALSVADMIAALYSGEIRAGKHEDRDRDRMVLSKGHAALALYAALHLRGVISDEELNSYCTDGTAVGVHPERALDGIDFSTGSLGHGLSIATGAALAARLEGSKRKVFALLSDAECNEGSVWEAAMFAAQHKLNNLTALIDVNGQQALGYTKDVIDLSPLEDKWSAFGWATFIVDGHNDGDIRAALRTLTDAPKALVCNTTFGKGVSFMESLIAWHYLPLTETDFDKAMAEVQ